MFFASLATIPAKVAPKLPIIALLVLQEPIDSIAHQPELANVLNISSIKCQFSSKLKPVQPAPTTAPPVVTPQAASPATLPSIENSTVSTLNAFVRSDFSTMAPKVKNVLHAPIPAFPAPTLLNV